MTNKDLEERVAELEQANEELRWRLDDLTEEEMLRALAGEPPHSALLRTFRRMIRERRSVAAATMSDPGCANPVHASGGVFYLDDLEGTFLELWKRARASKLRG
jgi:hypothetical protein